MSKIIEAIEKIIEAKRPLNLLKGRVIKAGDEYCSVEESETKKVYFKVKYTALLQNASDRILMKPKENSTVKFAVINLEKEAFILSLSEVEKLDGVLGATKFQLDNKGYKIESGGENLKQVLNDFITEVNKIVVVQGNTINVAAVQAIQQRLNKILQ